MSGSKNLGALGRQLTGLASGLSQASGLAQGLGGSSHQAHIQAHQAQIQASQQFSGSLNIQTPQNWRNFLDGREATVDLALEYLKKGSSDWGTPLTFIMSNFNERLKEIENSNPWQKSYDQIADEKEINDGT